MGRRATPPCAAATFKGKLWGFCRTLTCWCLLESIRLKLGRRPGNDFQHNAGVWDKGSRLKWPFLARFTSRDGLDESPSLIWLCGWNRLKWFQDETNSIYSFHDSSRRWSVRICCEVNSFIDLSGDIFTFLSPRSPHLTLYFLSVSSSRELRHFFCLVDNIMRSSCSAWNRNIWLISWISLCKMWIFHTKAPPNCMKCDSALSWPKGNKSPSLMHDCFLWYICGAVGDGAVAFQCSLGGGARCCCPVHRLRLTL